MEQQGGRIHIDNIDDLQKLGIFQQPPQSGEINMESDCGDDIIATKEVEDWINKTSKSNKFLTIESTNGGPISTQLLKDDYPNLYLDREITFEEMEAAIDLIATYFMQQDMYKLVVNMMERNIQKAPELEVTMAEVREKFGANVKIIG